MWLFYSLTWQCLFGILINSTIFFLVLNLLPRDCIISEAVGSTFQHDTVHNWLNKYLLIWSQILHFWQTALCAILSKKDWQILILVTPVLAPSLSKQQLICFTSFWEGWSKYQVAAFYFRCVVGTWWSVPQWFPDDTFESRKDI